LCRHQPAHDLVGRAPGGWPLPATVARRRLAASAGRPDCPGRASIRAAHLRAPILPSQSLRLARRSRSVTPRSDHAISSSFGGTIESSSHLRPCSVAARRPLQLLFNFRHPAGAGGGLLGLLVPLRLERCRDRRARVGVEPHECEDRVADRDFRRAGEGFRALGV